MRAVKIKVVCGVISGFTLGRVYEEFGCEVEITQ